MRFLLALAVIVCLPDRGQAALEPSSATVAKTIGAQAHMLLSLPDLPMQPAMGLAQAMQDRIHPVLEAAHEHDYVDEPTANAARAEIWSASLLTRAVADRKAAPLIVEAVAGVDGEAATKLERLAETLHESGRAKDFSDWVGVLVHGVRRVGDGSIEDLRSSLDQIFDKPAKL